MPKTNFVRTIGGSVLLFLLSVAVLRLSWNAVLPAALGVEQIDNIQSAALLAILLVIKRGPIVVHVMTTKVVHVGNDPGAECESFPPFGRDNNS